MSNIKFVKNFISNPVTIGALWPSSSFLAREIVRGVGLDKAKSAVELGPGTGAITPYILESIKPGTKFFAVELNTEMCECFRRKHPEITVYNEDACRLKDLASQEKLSHVDTVISCLPWSIFSPNLQDNILDAVIATLPKGGHFTTFAYLPGIMTKGGKRFRAKLQKRFHKVVRSRIEWRNIPPAFCYRCTK